MCFPAYFNIVYVKLRCSLTLHSCCFATSLCGRLELSCWTFHFLSLLYMIHHVPTAVQAAIIFSDIVTRATEVNVLNHGKIDPPNSKFHTIYRNARYILLT